MVPPGEGNEARGDGRRGVGVSHSTAEAGELSPRDPVEGRGHRQVAPLEGKTANTPRLGPVSTSRQRIAELARQALGMAVAIAWLPGPAGTRRRVAKLSVEEPDAAEPARPDLWGARVSNDPGLPDHRWATYKQIKDMGGQVRKGEKATHAASFGTRRQAGAQLVVELRRMMTRFLLFHQLTDTTPLEPERVVQLGDPALAQRRETLVELIRSQILLVLGVDQVEVVPGSDDPSRLEKETEDLRDVVVLDVAGDGGPGADIPGCVQTEQIRIEGALRKGDLVAFILETELDAWGWTVAKLERVAEPVGGEFVGIRHRSIFGSREPGVPREVVAMA